MEATYYCPKCGEEIKRDVDCGFEDYRRLENCPACGMLFGVVLHLTAEVYTLNIVQSKMNAEPRTDFVVADEEPHIHKYPRKQGKKPGPKPGGKRGGRKKAGTLPSSHPGDDYKPYGIPLSQKAFVVSNAAFRGSLMKQAMTYMEYRKNDGDYTWCEFVKVKCNGLKRNIY